MEKLIQNATQFLGEKNQEDEIQPFQSVQFSSTRRNKRSIKRTRALKFVGKKKN